MDSPKWQRRHLRHGCPCREHAIRYPLPEVSVGLYPGWSECPRRALRACLQTGCESGSIEGFAERHHYQSNAQIKCRMRRAKSGYNTRLTIDIAQIYNSTATRPVLLAQLKLFDHDTYLSISDSVSVLIFSGSAQSSFSRPGSAEAGLTPHSSPLQGHIKVAQCRRASDSPETMVAMARSEKQGHQHRRLVCIL